MLKYIIILLLILFFLYFVFTKNIKIEEEHFTEEININTFIESKEGLKNDLKDFLNLSFGSTIQLENIKPNANSLELDYYYNPMYLEKIDKKDFSITETGIKLLYDKKKNNLLNQYESINDDNIEHKELIISFIKTVQPNFSITNSVNTKIKKSDYLIKYKLENNNSKKYIKNYIYSPYLFDGNYLEKNYKRLPVVGDLKNMINDIKNETKIKINGKDEFKYKQPDNYEFLFEKLNRVDYNKLIKPEGDIYNYKHHFVLFPGEYTYTNEVLLDSSKEEEHEEMLKDNFNVESINDNIKIKEKEKFKSYKKNGYQNKNIIQDISYIDDIYSEYTKNKTKLKKLYYEYIVLYFIYNEYNIHNYNLIEEGEIYEYPYNRDDKIIDFVLKYVDIIKNEEDITVFKKEELEKMYDELDLQLLVIFIGYLDSKNLVKIEELKTNNYKLNNFYTDVSNKIKELKEKLSENKKSITYTVYYKHYDVIVESSGLSQLSNTEKNMDLNPRDLLHLIQDLLKYKLSKRTMNDKESNQEESNNDEEENKDKILEEKTQKLKERLQELKQLKDIEGNYTEPDELVDSNDMKYNNLFFIVKHLNEEIEKGNLTFINYFLSFDIKNDYVFPSKFEIKEEFSNLEKTGIDTSQKKMEGIYNRLKDMKNSKLFNINIDKTDIKKGVNQLFKYHNGNNNEFNNNEYYNESRVSAEHFIGENPHKHTKEGQITWNRTTDFKDPEWFRSEKNKELVKDYKFIPDEIKTAMLLNIADMENTIQNSNNYTENIYKEFKDKMNKPKSSVMSQLIEEKKLEKMNKDEKNAYLFQKKEKEQDEKMKNINMKIDNIQKIKNKVGNVEENHFNSIKSLSDGQTLSVSNVGDDMYNIHINQKCLGMKDGKLNVKKCSGDDNMKFSINNITNQSDYNEHIKDENFKVDENSGIFYPFDLVKYQEKCVGINGNNIFIDDCNDNKNQRYRASKIMKDCDRFSNL